MQDDLLTSGQAATRLGVSTMTVVRWSDREEDPLVCTRTRGGHRRFRSSVIAAEWKRLYGATQSGPGDATPEPQNTETPTQEETDDPQL